MGYFPIQCAQWLRQSGEEFDYSPSKALNKHTIRKAKCGTAVTVNSATVVFMSLNCSAQNMKLDCLITKDIL